MTKLDKIRVKNEKNAKVFGIFHNNNSYFSVLRFDTRDQVILQINRYFATGMNWNVSVDFQLIYDVPSSGFTITEYNGKTLTLYGGMEVLFSKLEELTCKN